MTPIDHGRRCDDHVGEPHRRRCTACDDLTVPLPPPRRRAYIPLSECALHRGYPMPCDRCERDNDMTTNDSDRKN